MFNVRQRINSVYSYECYMGIEEGDTEFMVKRERWLKQWPVNTLNRLLVLREVDISVYRFTHTQNVNEGHRDCINISWNTRRTYKAFNISNIRARILILKIQWDPAYARFLPDLLLLSPFISPEN